MTITALSGGERDLNELSPEGRFEVLHELLSYI